MGRFEHIVLRHVDHSHFAPREIAPEQEDDSVAVGGYISYYGIRKFHPAYLAVRGRLPVAYRQDRIEEKHALARPFLKMRIAAQAYSEVGLDLPENVAE